jgi:cytochrome c biogenesis protein CcmG/thiol:disulfide interchange protein DsbE
MRLAPIAVLVLLAGCTGTTDLTGGGVVAQSKPLPHLSGPAVGGGHLDTAAYTGKPLVLNAWATWCAPCRREQPALMRLHRRYGDSVGFVGIDYRDDSAAAKEWIRQYGVTYRSLSDPSGGTARDLGYPYLPDTYVADCTGTIRWVVFGQTDEQQLAGLIDRVLASCSPTA